MTTIDGYEVEENKYIVVAKTSYPATLSMLTSINVFPQPLTTFYKKIYYVDNEQQEDYITIQEDILHSGLITGEFSSRVISLLHEKPELIMNKESAEKLINAYRMMVPIEI